MAGTYIDIVSGKNTQIQANQTSAGAGDADKLIRLDASGKIDTSLLPSEALSGGLDYDIEASETISTGDAINIFNDGGTLKVRKADATDDTKPAEGFANDGGTSGATISVRFGAGTLTKTGHGFTLGATLYLSTTPGALTATAPSGSGNLVQRCGKVFDANTILFNDSDNPVTLA